VQAYFNRHAFTARLQSREPASVPDAQTIEAVIDAAFFNADNQSQAQAKGIEKLAVPNKRTRRRAQWEYQHQRWFRRAKRWRVGCEGRISVLETQAWVAAMSLSGNGGLERSVGWGAIANNLMQIGKGLAR